MTRIVINLPFPPSVNHVWTQKPGGSYLSKKYTAWKLLAGQEWLTQKKNQPRTIPGPYSAIIILVRPPDKRRRDIDNYIKAIKDFAVQHLLIEDDSLCERLYVRWGSAKEAKLGAKLILKSTSILHVAISARSIY